MKNAISEKQNLLLIRVGILLIAALFFIPFLGSVPLFDWDEINFAESAREMILTGDYLNVQIDFTSFWEKPPLFIWIQVVSMKVFGINEFAARFPNAVIGIITLLLLFNIGRKHVSTSFGLLWTLTYFGSILPFIYFKSGIIDPLFNLFIFLGIYQFYLFSSKKKQFSYINIALSALFIGLGILTKGPVALLIFGLTAFLYMILEKRYSHFLNWRVFLLFIPIVTIVGGFWFILLILNGNTDIISDFIQYQLRLFNNQDAGHGGFFGYHFIILFFGVFPASIFALINLNFKRLKNREQHEMKRWMALLFWVVLILFSIVKTKIVHYSSMCYFPITFFAALTLQNIVDKGHMARWIKITTLCIATIIGTAVALFYFFGKYKQVIIDSGIIKDEFAIGNLQADVSWPFYITLLALLFIMATTLSLFGKLPIRIKLFALFGSNALFVALIMFSVVPRIEHYSQHSAVAFYTSLAGKECYVDTYAMKSYAKLFYAQRQPYQSEKEMSKDLMLSGKIDKPVFIVLRNKKREEFEHFYPHFSLINEKNGFAFYSWEPN